MVSDSEKDLFEKRVKQITDKQFFQFSVQEYVTVLLTDIIEVRFLPKKDLAQCDFNFAIPILEYYWINRYNGQDWKNQVQEYLGVYKRNGTRLNLVSGIELNANKVTFGEFHHLGFSDSRIDVSIKWGNNSTAYDSHINALVLSGKRDLSRILAIAKYCCNNEEAAAFLKFGYDARYYSIYSDNYLCYREAVIMYKKEILRLQKIIDQTAVSKGG